MSVCYFIQSHRAPRQVLRLVRAIRRASPAAEILVGHDGPASDFEAGELAALSGVELFRPEGPVERGSLSLLDPYFEAARRLASRGADYRWLVYLSGQDYPVRPVAESERFLAETEFDGFLTWWDAFGADNPWGRRRQGLFRYAYRYRRGPDWLVPWLRPFRWVNRLQSLVHLHLTYGCRVGIRCRRTPFTSSLVCYAGSQWTTLRRECVEYLLAALPLRADLVAHYRGSICSDESLVQTILVNSGRFRLSNDNLRYADFRGSRTGSPRILDCADVEQLITGGYHFARKFDEERDGAVLDRLDERNGAPVDAEARAASPGIR